jgi:hypothetical protein
MGIAARGRHVVPGVALGVALTALAGCGSGATANGGSVGPPITLKPFQAADVVIGQADFAGADFNQGGAAGAGTLALPLGAPAEGSLYLADPGNHRILGFNAVPTTAGAGADFVIGQPDFSSHLSGTDANRFNNPAFAATWEGRLFVADRLNRRVLIWNSLPLGDVPADVVVGAADLTAPGAGGASRTTIADPYGMAAAEGRLLVVDGTNHRVLIWNAIPTASGAPADMVLGQESFTENVADVSASALNSPRDVWSDGTRVVVSDAGNNRVLIWSTFPTANDAAADVVVGQASFTSNSAGAGAQGLSTPYGVSGNGSQLIVADSGNNRVLVYDPFPTANHPSADVVIGQSTLTNSVPNDDDQNGSNDGVPSARTLNLPAGVRLIGDQLFVADNQNNRVLIYLGQ